MKIDKIVMALAAMGLIIGGADAAQPDRFARGGPAGPMKLISSNAMSPAKAVRAGVIARVPDTIYDDEDDAPPALHPQLVRQNAMVIYDDEDENVPPAPAQHPQLVRQNAMVIYDEEDDAVPPVQHPQLVRQNAMVRYDDEEDENVPPAPEQHPQLMRQNAMVRYDDEEDEDAGYEADIDSDSDNESGITVPQRAPLLRKDMR